MVNKVEFADIDFFCCSPEVKFKTDEKGKLYRWTFSVATDVS